MVDFLLRMYATNEVVVEASTDGVTLRQGSNMTEKSYSNDLWDKAFQRRSVFVDWRLMSFFVEGLLSETCAQVRNYLATHARANYQSVAQYAQAPEDTGRCTRRQVGSSSLLDELDSKS